MTSGDRTPWGAPGDTRALGRWGTAWGHGGTPWWRGVSPGSVGWWGEPWECGVNCVGLEVLWECEVSPRRMRENRGVWKIP